MTGNESRFCGSKTVFSDTRINQPPHVVSEPVSLPVALSTAVLFVFLQQVIRMRQAEMNKRRRMVLFYSCMTAFICHSLPASGISRNPILLQCCVATPAVVSPKKCFGLSTSPAYAKAAFFRERLRGRLIQRGKS